MTDQRKRIFDRRIFDRRTDQGIKSLLPYIS